MLFQITAPLTAPLDKQADEFERLLKHSRTLTVQFVTVAGGYKPARARLLVLSAPDKFAEQTARVMTVVCGREDAAKPSQLVRTRPEWKHRALLLPTRPDAVPLDGTLLDGWSSALLSVTYQPNRAMARLVYCPEDCERVANVKLDGWQLIVKPNPFQLAAYTAGRAWNGVPSFAPVPGGVAAAIPQPAAGAVGEVSAIKDALLPIAQEVCQALSESPDGFVLGATPEGRAVRLARRAMTLAIEGPLEARQHAVLALLQRGVQDGMGMVVMVERSLLPIDVLQAWDRVRMLDVQDIAASSAISWREIAPDLLAQAIGGPSASLPVLPSRFGAVLDALHAESLCVPEVLGLLATPGDDLRGALAAGGLLVVPQDGDAASQIVARLLLADLATPPAIGRGLLLLSDASIVPPETLQQQAIQVVLGKRGDALLRLTSTDTGWKLSQPDGTPIVELLPDFLIQPTASADAPVGPIHAESAGQDPVDAENEWWSMQGFASEQEPVSDLDTALGSLLNALLAELPTNATEERIQAAVAGEDFAAADAWALAWSIEAPQFARAWLWRIVLVEQDSERLFAARQAIKIEPGGTLALLTQEVLDLCDTQPVVQAFVTTPTMPACDPACMDDDEAMRMMWQGGESISQIVARLVACGVDAPTARARVRAIVNARA